MRAVVARTAGIAGALALLLVLAGCISVKREEGAPFVAPPEDPLRERWEADIARLSTEELQFPEIREYVIGPGDVLSLAFVGRPDLLPIRDEGGNFTIQVTESPTIVLPLVGEVVVHGKTAAELQEALREAYLPYIRDPIPVVRIEQFFYNQVTVLGAVPAPGTFALQPGDTVVDMLFRAGGLTLGGGGSRPPARFLKIYRQKLTQRERMTLPPREILAFLREDQRIVPREEIIIPIEEFLIGGDLNYNIPVRPDDIIFVPPAGTVMVVGDVRSPGVKVLGPSVRTLVHVLTVSGRPAFEAASVVEVVRTNPDGTQESYFLHARRMLRRREPDFFMQDNDQIFVYRAGWRTGAKIITDIFTFGVGASARVTTGYELNAGTDNRNR